MNIKKVISDIETEAIIDLGVKEAEKGFNNYNRMVRVMAKRRKASYDAHIEQGFSESQAISLCKMEG